MRQKIILSLIFSISFISINAQKNFSPYSEIGLKAIGGNYAIGLKNSYNDLLIGTGLGIQFLHVGEKYLGILIEANYTTIGSIVKNEVIELETFTIPFFSHIYVPIKKSSIFINAGPYLVFNVSQKNRDNYPHTDNSTFIGLGGGLGFKRNFTESSLSLEGRFHFNLTENYKSVSNTIVQRTTWSEVALCYAFKL